MSKIFEVFGYPLDSDHADAVKYRKAARCPFLENDCDGGGNRYLSALQLRNHPELAKHFIGKDVVQAGVCSLMVQGRPWIVCPRRLFALGSPNRMELQKMVRNELIACSGLSPNVEYRAWSEVKMKVSTQNSEDEEKTFDYTFDYVLAGSCREPISEIARIVGKSERICERIAIDNQFTLAKRSGITWVDNFPGDPVVIVEIMTSSTSGGNKTKRTQIGMAFEDAILKGPAHEGPGINYRQVWARMVSQLIVKSQVGLAWGGKTIWVLQDVLAEYISSSTGLNLQLYLNSAADEVNILAFGYGDSPSPNRNSGVVQLEDSQFYAGPISTAPESAGGGGFVDIIKMGAAPPKEHLWRSLFKKTSCGKVRG